MRKLFIPLALAGLILSCGEKKEEKKEDNTIVSEELVRWMTEGSNPNNIPRSDCG